ncbi:MAG: hypothetical protein SFT93_05350, partial [Rickettsiaceae bacterium]|nr:hypothetical protein [Rickettsiaceae bacterium]
NYHSKYMTLVAEKLNMLKMNQDEKNEYYHYRKRLITDEDSIHTAREEGREEGIKLGEEKGREEGIKLGEEKGREEGMRLVALNMLKQGLSKELISSVTSFTIEELKKLENAR